jgi:hypothetical protein
MAMAASWCPTPASLQKDRMFARDRPWQLASLSAWPVHGPSLAEAGQTASGWSVAGQSARSRILCGRSLAMLGRLAFSSMEGVRNK